MDLIRLFFNSIDVELNVLLVHFLYYLGFYVEKIEDLEIKSEAESIADIYTISNAFLEEQEDMLHSVDKTKAILVMTEGWYTNNVSIRSIRCDNINNETEFLKKLVQYIFEIIEDNDRGNTRLLRSGLRWKEMVNFFIEKYMDNKLLKASLFTRCFYKQTQFYDWGIQNYRDFICSIESKIIEYYNEGEQTDYLQYVLIRSKYEANLISKINLQMYQFNTDEMLEQCTELLFKYKQNEQLYFLKADILYELNGDWIKGYKAYGLEELSHCSYAYFKSGKILRVIFKKYEEAVLVLSIAIQRNKKYFQAWYQLGDCYENLGKYDKAIDCFQEICNILENKYRNKLLAPIELEYYYKALMRIGVIYKVRLGDYSTAYLYSEEANSMKEQHVIENYVYLMWGYEENLGNMIQEINEAVKKHVDIKLEEIY